MLVIVMASGWTLQCNPLLQRFASWVRTPSHRQWCSKRCGIARQHNPLPTSTLQAKRGRRATRTQEEPVRTSRRRQPAAPDDNPSTTVQEEPTEAAAEPPTQRVTRARARRPKSDAPATHVVTRKTRARAKRGAKAEGERPSIAVAASELGDAGTTVGVLEQIVEEHESPAAPSSAPPTPPPMASPEREAAALDAPAGQQTASTPPHCEEPCVEQPAPAARTTPQAAPLPAAPHRTPLSVPAAAQGRMAASLSHGALLASCSRVRRAVVAFREAQQEPAAPEEPPTAAEAPQISSVPCVEAQQPSAPPPPPSMASNVVATIRSFLPAAKPMAPPGPAAGKKPIKVCGGDPWVPCPHHAHFPARSKRSPLQRRHGSGRLSGRRSVHGSGRSWNGSARSATRCGGGFNTFHVGVSLTDVAAGKAGRGGAAAGRGAPAQGTGAKAAGRGHNTVRLFFEFGTRKCTWASH